MYAGIHSVREQCLGQRDIEPMMFLARGVGVKPCEVHNARHLMQRLPHHIAIVEISDQLFFVCRQGLYRTGVDEAHSTEQGREIRADSGGNPPCGAGDKHPFTLHSNVPERTGYPQPVNGIAVGRAE